MKSFHIKTYFNTESKSLKHAGDQLSNEKIGEGGEHQEEPLPLTSGGGGAYSEKTSEADTLLYFKALLSLAWKCFHRKL